MDPITGSIIAGSASGGLGILGNIMGNQASSAQAQRQMDFQQEMSNTAHQREVKDLRAAGLNPILSALGSGASTPGGAMGTVNDFAPSISKGFDTAIAVRGQQKQIQQQDAQIENTGADTFNKRQQSALISNQAQQTALETKKTALQNTVLEKTLPAMIKKANAEGDYSEINQIMGVIQSGASSAGNILNLGNIIKSLVPGKK